MEATCSRPAELQSDADLASRLARIESLAISYLPIDFSNLREQTISWPELTVTTVLDHPREAFLFRQMNLAFYQADQIRQSLDRDAPDTSCMADIERLTLRGQHIRNALAVVFTRLSVSIARNFLSGRFPLDELVSEAQTTLLYAISKFNPDRGFRFTTYATYALRRRLVRYVNSQQVTREVCGELEANRLPDYHRWTYSYERRIDEAVTKADLLLHHLSARERYVIRSRFGWGREFEPRTLQDIADELGVSRERIRQLESRALRKLREFAAQAD